MTDASNFFAIPFISGEEDGGLPPDQLVLTVGLDIVVTPDNCFVIYG